MSKSIASLMQDLLDLQTQQENIEQLVKQTRQAIRDIVPLENTQAIPTSFGTIAFKTVQKWGYSGVYEQKEKEAKALLKAMQDVEKANGTAQLISENIAMQITLNK